MKRKPYTYSKRVHNNEFVINEGSVYLSLNNEIDIIKACEALNMAFRDGQNSKIAEIKRVMSEEA